MSKVSLHWKITKIAFYPRALCLYVSHLLSNIVPLKAMNHQLFQKVFCLSLVFLLSAVWHDAAHLSGFFFQIQVNKKNVTNTFCCFLGFFLWYLKLSHIPGPDILHNCSYICSWSYLVCITMRECIFCIVWAVENDLKCWHLFYRGPICFEIIPPPHNRQCVYESYLFKQMAICYFSPDCLRYHSTWWVNNHLGTAGGKLYNKN